MATSTLEDQALLQQLFQAPFSPIQRYGEGLLQIAAAKKAREETLADQTRKEEFQLSRDAAERDFQLARDATSAELQAQRDMNYQRFQLKLQEAAQKQADKHQKDAWDHADKTRKEDILIQLRGEATKLGLPVPSKDDSFDAQFEALSGSINSTKAKSVTSLMQMIGQTENEISQATGTDARERMRMAMQLLFSPRNADITKVVSAGERQELLNNPEAMTKVLARLSRDTSKKGVAAFQALFDAHQEAKAIADEEYLKRAGSRDVAVALRGKLDQQRLILANTLRDTVLSPQAIVDMFQGIGDTAKSLQAERQSQDLPPLPRTVAPGSAVNPETGAVGVPRLPVTPFPERPSPSTILNAALRAESAGAPAGGTAFRGIGATSTPALDLYGEILGNRLGMPVRQVGSSVYNRPRILDIISSPGLRTQLNAIGPEESDRLAMTAITNAVGTLPANNPTRLRLARYLSDRAAIAPQAFPAAPDLFAAPEAFSPGLRF